MRRLSGEVMFNNLNVMFMEFVKDGCMTLADLRNAVARQTRPIAHLIAADPGQ